MLYSAYVRSNLDFASIVSNPNTQYLKNKNEKFQNRFLQSYYYKTFSSYPHELAYIKLFAGFEIQSLPKRRLLAGLGFLWNLLNNKGI